MTSVDELRKRREAEALRIRASLNRQRGVCLLYTSPSPRD